MSALQETFKASMVPETCSQTSITSILLDGLSSPIERSTYLFQQDSFGSTALIHASAVGSFQAVARLLQEEACSSPDYIRHSNLRGTNALIEACASQYDSIVSLLLDYLPQDDRIEYIQQPMFDSFNAFLHSCAAGHLSTVKLLLDSVSTIQDMCRVMLSETDEGCTALLLACEEGHFEMVHFLLQSLPTPDMRKKAIYQEALDGYTPLMVASLHGYADIVALLLQYLDSETSRTECVLHQIFDGSTPLLAACDNGHNDIVPILLDTLPTAQIRSKYILHRSENGFSALLCAYMRKSDIVSTLLPYISAHFEPHLDSVISLIKCFQAAVIQNMGLEFILPLLCLLPNEVYDLNLAEPLDFACYIAESLQSSTFLLQFMRFLSLLCSRDPVLVRSIIRLIPSRVQDENLESDTSSLLPVLQSWTNVIDVVCRLHTKCISAQETQEAMEQALMKFVDMIDTGDVDDHNEKGARKNKKNQSRKRKRSTFKLSPDMVAHLMWCGDAQSILQCIPPEFVRAIYVFI